MDYIVFIIPVIWAIVLLVKYQLKRSYAKGYIKGIEDAKTIVNQFTIKP